MPPRIPRRTLLQYIIDHNPFYLLSAICMLAGCIALTNSTSWTSIRFPRLLALIFTLNVYELLMIGWAVFLIRKRRLMRDGVILLILEAFFLVDVTFLNSEIFSANFRIGVIINVMIFALGIAKVLAIFRALGMQISYGAFPLVLIELAMLFAMPGVFKHVSTSRGGALPAAAIYGSWWMIGLIPVLATILLRESRKRLVSAQPVFDRAPRLVGLLMILPAISLMAHVSTSNWIYNVRWYSANVSPLLLGLALAIGAYDWHVSSLAIRMRAQLALPVLAMLLSMTCPSALTMKIDGVALTTLRWTAVATILVYLEGFWLYRHLYFAWGAVTLLLAAASGADVASIQATASSFAQCIARTARRLAPRSSTDWGIIAIGASFVLLGIGALVSMLKKTPNEEQLKATTDA
jgi:hypothetical protein